ncbi:MAG: ABC transporter transmembrane domain-containing protein [Pseudomonadota bacterium]
MFSLYRHLAWFMRENARAYVISLMMLTGVAVFNLAIPYLTGRTVDAIAAGTLTRSELWMNIFLLLLLGLMIYVLRYSWRSILYGTSYRLGAILRERYYQRLLRLGPAFYQAHGTGDLMARATNDIDAVEMAAGEGILSGFDGFLTFILVLAMLFFIIDWRLACIALLPFPAMAWGFKKISTALHHQFNTALNLFSDLNDRTQEALSGIRLTKAMGRESEECASFNKIAREAAEINFKVQRTEAWYGPVIFLALSLSFILSLGYGGFLIYLKELTVGQLTSFNMYLGQLIWPMFAFGWLLNIVERGSAAQNRVQEMLNMQDTLIDIGKHDLGVELKNNMPTIHWNIKEFNYPNHTSTILENINLTLDQGKTLGIVGPTGSGKTTLIALLMRQYDLHQLKKYSVLGIDRSAITINEIPLPEFNLHSLRQAFAYVPQDAFLFSASIAQNIALGKPDATQEEIRQVAKLAALEDDIRRLPQGYETLVGERGVTLSGGQRQRVAIARALLMDAPILVLDDALSAVDVHTERTILNHLKSAREARTTIIISHRLSAVMDADQIIVLHQGKIREQATHQQLLTAQDWYAKLWNYQQLEASLDV